MTSVDKQLWWVQELCLDVLDDSKDEWTCICPFCLDDRHHFYLNAQQLLYDCKICGACGNYLSLLEQLAKYF